MVNNGAEITNIDPSAALGASDVVASRVLREMP
jgi:hypothetical protein